MEPSGPLQACNGTDLPFYLQISQKLFEMKTSMFTAQLTAQLQCFRLTAATLHEYSRKYGKMV